eukprot:scaffold31570_cov42-Phaeocystis_antarctica.AAC.1
MDYQRVLRGSLATFPCVTISRRCRLHGFGTEEVGGWVFLAPWIIGAKSKAQKHAFWPALCSAACGGAVHRCAAPSAAARALRAAPPGRYAPSALRAHP